MEKISYKTTSVTILDNIKSVEFSKRFQVEGEKDGKKLVFERLSMIATYDIKVMSLDGKESTKTVKNEFYGDLLHFDGEDVAKSWQRDAKLFNESLQNPAKSFIFKVVNKESTEPIDGEIKKITNFAWSLKNTAETFKLEL